jgi:hypothetical protein
MWSPGSGLDGLSLVGRGFRNANQLTIQGQLIRL